MYKDGSAIFLLLKFHETDKEVCDIFRGVQKLLGDICTYEIVLGLEIK